MRYRKPEAVLSPKDTVSNVKEIYDGGEDSISVAKLQWHNETVYGIRWNVAMREWDDSEKQSERKECLGLPISRGNPVWFIIPQELLDRNSELWKKIDEGKNKIEGLKE
jgi:hypothetical protein